MKFLLIVVIWLVMGSFSVFAADKDISDYDGTEWSGYTRSEKHFFISGFMAASAHVISQCLQSLPDKYDAENAATVYVSYLLPDNKKPKKVFNRKEVELILNSTSDEMNSYLTKFGIYGITNGQIVEGVDQLYSDFKNKNLRLRELIYVVKRQIHGASAEEIEAILQYLRSGKDFRKLSYVDKDGKKKYATFP